MIPKLTSFSSRARACVCVFVGARWLWQLYDVTGAALLVGYRVNQKTLLRTLTLAAEVADLGGDLTFGTVRCTHTRSLDRTYEMFWSLR